MSVKRKVNRRDKFLFLCVLPDILSPQIRTALRYRVDDRGFESQHGLGVSVFTTTSRLLSYG